MLNQSSVQSFDSFDEDLTENSFPAVEMDLDNSTVNRITVTVNQLHAL